MTPRSQLRVLTQNQGFHQKIATIRLANENAPSTIFQTPADYILSIFACSVVMAIVVANSWQALVWEAAQ